MSLPIGNAGSTGVVNASDGVGKGDQFVEIVAQNRKYTPMIDLKVHMDEDVTQTRPATEMLGDSGVDDIVLRKHLKRVPIALRRTLGPIRDEVMRQVEAGFDCDLNPTLGLRLQAAVAQEDGVVGQRQRSEVDDDLLELGEPAIKNLGVDQSGPPATARGGRPRGCGRSADRLRQGRES